jgi:hypothetical protein
MCPLEKLRLGEHRSVAVWKICLDNISGKLGAETAKLGEPLMAGAEDTEVAGALFVGTLGHGTQPDGRILLGDALGHGSQIFGIDPAIAVLQRFQKAIVASRFDLSGLQCVWDELVRARLEATNKFLP